MTASTIFADFNDPGDAPTPPPEPEAPPPADPTASIREEAWTEGYLIARREPPDEDPTAALMARLLTSLHDLGTESAATIETASLAVAGLVVNTVIAVASDEWSATLPGRVRALAERIKPALTVAPEFLLRDTAGIERPFADIAALTRALEDGISGEDVTIKWQRGEATISRSALLADLRDAVLPVSASLVTEQNVRHLS
ncbi:MAG TPA: hypothetical protein DDZ81_17030 [Acetobacteraceae bacterium]|jgi:hypothetical protein|nr:hypothetical protein [Acetobacteraceae bacterium]